MTGTVWLVRYAEVFLKSDPVRRNWERVLAHAIERRMPGVAVRVERGRLWATGPVDPAVLRRVFGVASFSEAVFAPLDDLDAAVLVYADAHGIGEAASFAIRVKRSGRHDFRSPEKAADLGGVILEAHPGLTVDLGCPEFESFVEIRDDRCYLYHEVVAGPGGLPEGVEGTLVALFSGGIDSPVAAYMMMRRGCRVVPLYVGLEPYLDEDALAKARAVLAVLRDYDPDLETGRPDRRLPLPGQGADAAERGAPDLRRLQAAHVPARGRVRRGGRRPRDRDRRVPRPGREPDPRQPRRARPGRGVPVFRPLIGLDKEEIIGIARRIGTFTPSIAPGRGCRAVPDVAATKAALAEVAGIEARVDPPGRPASRRPRSDPARDGPRPTMQPSRSARPAAQIPGIPADRLSERALVSSDAPSVPGRNRFISLCGLCGPGEDDGRRESEGKAPGGERGPRDPPRVCRGPSSNPITSDTPDEAERRGGSGTTARAEDPKKKRGPPSTGSTSKTGTDTG